MLVSIVVCLASVVECCGGPISRLPHGREERPGDGKIEVGLGTVCRFEVEATQCVKQAALPPVKGRLREHLVFWRENNSGH